MEEFNNKSLENGFNYSNMSSNFINTYDNNDTDLVLQSIKWVDWISTGIGLPLTLVVMIAVFLQVKRDQDAPVYVINLLFSDLIQFCSRILMNLLSDNFIPLFIFITAITASVGLMICISLERYMIIAKPLWYRFRRNIKTSVVVCIVIWVLSFLTIVIGTKTSFFVLACVFLLPFPLFIFFLVGTIKALSGTRSVPADEKRRIVAIQVVVLLIYALLFLPYILTILYNGEFKEEFILLVVTLICIYLSPLADTTLYLFIRKSILDNFLASVCSCKISKNQEISSTEYESRIATNTETV